MRLLLVDATGYLFRAFYAIADIRTTSGAPTGAILGLMNMLTKLRGEYQADRIACIMDAPGKTFRHDMSPDYKANRPPLNPDLREQIEPAKQFIIASGWPLICQSGVEADDVIATLALQGASAGMEVIIASSDKDLMYLVGQGQIRLFDSMKEKSYDADAVIKKFGVAPERMADYLALVGDSSDNIRGVAKVGPKTAVKWLDTYGDINGIIREADSISGVVGENLRTAINGGGLALAQKLVALKIDVELSQTAEELLPTKPDLQIWHTLCEQYEFRKLSKQFDSESDSETVVEITRANLETIDALPQLKKHIEAARTAGVVALDVETDGATVMQASLTGFSLAYNSTTAFYVPLAHVPLMHEAKIKQIPLDNVLQCLRPLLEDESVVKIFHNGKYDIHVFANYDLHVAGKIEDTKIAATLLSPGQQTTLSALAAEYLKTKTTSFRDVVDGKTVKQFANVDIETATRYAAEDSEITYKLQTPVLAGLSPTAKRIYEEIERPLMLLLQSMERTGFRIDGEELKRLSKEMQKRMRELEKQAYAEAGGKFNLNSPRQLETLLFDEMGATSLRKTVGGKSRSTDERTLEKLAADYPLAKIVLAHRTLAKLTNTYADKLPKMADAKTGRVHTDFNQTSVNTGRLSSNSPNLQNIPIRTADGRRIRRAFAAKKGCVLISADYSQIELRLMAHISGDAVLLKAFAEGADIHSRTAAEVFDVVEVSDEQRRAAKAINFGLIYGMSAFGLAQALNISREQAQEYINRYFARYPQVAVYMESIRKQAAEDKKVETIIGRQIAISSGNKQAALRAAINAPMQGSAADIIKIAMLITEAWLRKNNMETCMILQVHDELIFEAPTEEADKVMKKLPFLMGDEVMAQLSQMGVELKTPLEISVGSGDNWDDAH
ncbi:MAG: DNA polymerase I [Gammaproteobacteria bacterium WSBS_2016_MAG_OTU1]